MKVMVGALMSALLVSSAFANITVKNNTPYPAELSGVTGATVSVDPFFSGVTSQLQVGQKPMRAHVMLMDMDGMHYVDNILIAQSLDKAGQLKLQAYDLYGKVKVTVDNNNVVIG